MRTRKKMDVVRDIERSREEFEAVWQHVRAKNPVTVGTRAAMAAMTRWKTKAGEKARETDHEIRTSPWKFLGIAAALGVCASILMKAARGPSQPASLSDQRRRRQEHRFRARGPSRFRRGGNL